MTMPAHVVAIPDNTEKIPDTPTTREPVLVDKESYKTEDNWLTTIISSDIADWAFVAVNPNQPLPDLKVKAEVDPAKALVHVEIGGFSGGTDTMTTSDLTPAFAWDPEGYAPLASQLLGKTAGLPPPVSDSEGTNILGNLLVLAGPQIAREDVRLSAELEQHPASWQTHEAAALDLLALALRENAGRFSDNRNLLCRAAAHLALARALRGNPSAGWPGLIADAAIRTLSGRELDALSHLDALATRMDCSAPAKTWITALRLIAKQDWRLATVKSDSPLLLKIAWFQVLGNDLSDVAATHHLDEVVLQPQSDPNAPSSQSPPTNPELQVPDWGRAVIATNFEISVQNSGRFTAANMPLEFQELDEVLKIEGHNAIDQKNLAATFATGVEKTILSDSDGKPEIHVIGANSFISATRRHLFNDIKPAYYGIGTGQGDAAEADVFLSQMNILFRGVPQFELTEYDAKPRDPSELQSLVGELREQGITWSVWEVPAQLVGGLPGYPLVQAFYSRGVPFGTAYCTEERISIIDNFAREDYPSANDEIKRIMQLPPDQRSAALLAFQTKYNANPGVYEPQTPTPLARELLKLAPDQYVLATDCVPPNQLLSYAAPFLDYKMRPIEQIEHLATNLDDATREQLLRKHSTLDPDAYFPLADLLRKEGKFDEAAETARKGAAEAYDQVGMANSIWFLVDYDLDHGLDDEALSIAKRAADVYSEGGLDSYLYVLERLGRFDEAEECGKAIEQRYSDDTSLTLFYARNRDRYPEKYEEAVRRFFPNGLIKTDLASFTKNPDNGCEIENDSAPLKKANLRPGDVIVSLDGYRVGSQLQYVFVRGLTFKPDMDFIVWRNQKYLEIKATLPNRRFDADIQDYYPQ